MLGNSNYHNLTMLLSNFLLPRKKFNKEEAGKMWSSYTKTLVDSISDSEKEGFDKGLSSYQIERLWQEKVTESSGKSQKKDEEKKED